MLNFFYILELDYLIIYLLMYLLFKEFIFSFCFIFYGFTNTVLH